MTQVPKTQRHQDTFIFESQCQSGNGRLLRHVYLTTIAEMQSYFWIIHCHQRNKNPSSLTLSSSTLGINTYCRSALLSYLDSALFFAQCFPKPQAFSSYRDLQQCHSQKKPQTTKKPHRTSTVAERRGSKQVEETGV